MEPDKPTTGLEIHKVIVIDQFSERYFKLVLIKQKHPT